ncbi:hypothetical protein [Bifidobacterium primatium]|uniref:hypothetical protein n=1 Tax=Bifidobacterium primatium TaxID=2045438 RepID=UPI0013FDB86E|nr:hypothetical protein [Bifidobacterium primatium]
MTIAQNVAGDEEYRQSFSGTAQNEGEAMKRAEGRTLSLNISKCGNDTQET